MDVSLQREEHFQQIMNDISHIEESIRYEQQGLTRLQAELDESNRKQIELEMVKPTDEEMLLAKKVPSLVNQLAELKARQHISHEFESHSSPSKMPFIVSGLILIVSMIGAVLLSNWLLAGFGVLLAGIILVLLLKGQQPAPQADKKDYHENISLVEEELSKAEHVSSKVKTYHESKKHIVDQQSEKQHLQS